MARRSRDGKEPAYVKTASVVHLRNPFCRLLLPASSVGRPSSRRRAKLHLAPRLARMGSHGFSRGRRVSKRKDRGAVFSCRDTPPSKEK